MSEKEYKKILVVDENNENPRAVTYDEAIANGWIRRASRVFVMNKSGKILIQQRSRHISKPLLLDNSAAGHVDEGEKYVDAAIRELHEELGVSVSIDDLVILPMVRETSFFAQIYLVHVLDNVEIAIDPYETEAYFWYTREEIDELVETESERCSPSLVEVWPQIRDSIFA